MRLLVENLDAPSDIGVAVNRVQIEVSPFGPVGPQGPPGDVSLSTLQAAHGYLIWPSDSLAEMQAVADLVAGLGGGAVVAVGGEGEFDLNGLLIIPSSVSLTAQAGGQTESGVWFNATTIGAGIVFGHANYDTPSDMGISGGFKVDGGGVALNPLTINFVVNGTFRNIDVENGASTGIRCRRMSNCLLENVNAINAGDDALQMDGGCSGNEFNRCNFALGGRYNANLISTLGASPFGEDYNIDNVFVKCYFELHQETTLASFHQSAGLDNALVYCGITTSGTNDGGAMTLVHIDQPGTPFSGKLRIHGSTLQHNFTAAGTVGIDVSSITGIGVILSGVPNFVGSNTAMKFGASSAASGSIIMEGEAIFVGVSNKTSGAAADAMLGQTRMARLEIRRPSSTTAFRIGLEGEIGWRTVMGPDGSVGFADGTNAVDVFFFRAGAQTLAVQGRLSVSDYLAVTGAFGANGATPRTKHTLGAAATDLASVIALANNLRTMAINNGMGQA